MRLGENGGLHRACARRCSTCPARVLVRPLAPKGPALASPRHARKPRPHGARSACIARVQACTEGGRGGRSALGQGTALKSSRDAAVRLVATGWPRSATTGGAGAGRGRTTRLRTAVGEERRRLLAAGVGGSVTAVTKGVVAEGRRADAQRRTRRAEYSAEGVARARTPGRGARRTGARRCWARAAGRWSRRSAAEEDGVALGRSALPRKQRRCPASCHGEGGEPTRGDSGRCVSARSRAVGSTRARVRAEVGECLCPYLTWAGSAQLGARPEWQELSRHVQPTSERPPAAREDNIAVAIVQGNSESA